MEEWEEKIPYLRTPLPYLLSPGAGFDQSEGGRVGETVICQSAFHFELAIEKRI